MMTKPAAVMLACLVTAPGLVVSANVGEPLAQAKIHSSDYGKRYGAVAPIFKTDAAGRISLECWAAPPEQWTKAQALALAKELLPPMLRSAIPKALPPAGTAETFVWADGTRLILFGRRGRYDEIEVRSSNSLGDGC
jgi:hypothetical protein